MKSSAVVFTIVGVAVVLSVCICPASAQDVSQLLLNGNRIVVPESSIPHPGRIHTNYFVVNPENWNAPQPPPGAETPPSVACVYKLVKQVKGCPIDGSTNIPTGGVGAIAIVDAGDYPSAKSDLDTFSKQFGIPLADFKVVYANGHKPPVYSDWEVEEALDIEWSHAMAPAAKLFLVESQLCNSDECDTDPTWKAVEVAGKLVAENGGGVISMSWGDSEWAQETKYDHYMTTPGVVYFAAAGDSGIGATIHPAASPNVVAVGGTYFNRDSNGNFETEIYGGGGGGLSPYEPRPAFQDGIKQIVGTVRGMPDVGSDFCCAAIYLQGWGSVGGTSWSSPTFAGIVNAAGSLEKSSQDENVMFYTELTNKKEYKADFFDITQGSSDCTTGWDFCAGVGSARTYAGK
jgi:subtilase family serine protease